MADNSNGTSPYTNTVIGAIGGVLNGKGLAQYAAYAESIGLKPASVGRTRLRYAA